MKLFTLNETVSYKGHSMKVKNVYNDGKTADLECEIIPFMPTTCMGVEYTSVQR